MKRKLILIALVFLMVFMIPSNVEAQTAILEIQNAPDTVTVDEEFSFRVMISSISDDVLGYDYFKLYAIAPSGEEVFWGVHFFDAGDWIIYSRKYTISLRETGYYSLYVDAGDFFASDVDTITRSFSVYAEEKKPDPSFIPSASELLLYAGVIILIVIVCIGLVTGKKRKKSKEEPSVELNGRMVVIKGRLASRGGISPESIRKRFVTEKKQAPRGDLSESPRERIVTERVLVICPYCGAKTEQGIMKCQNCGAEL